MQSELGKLSLNSYIVRDGKKTIYNSGRQFLPTKQPKEAIGTHRFKELAIGLPTDLGYAKSARLLNRIRNDEDNIKTTTLRNMVEAEGLGIQKHMKAKSEKILSEKGITIAETGELQQSTGFAIEEPQYISEEVLQAAAAKLNLKSFNRSDYESLESSVITSIDDVLVKRQTEWRPREKYNMAQTENVNNTIIHIQKGESCVVINSGSLKEAITPLTAFFAENKLLGKQLVFIMDGAREINKIVSERYKGLNFKIILDWYHLYKKMREQLSMGLNGKEIRNEFLQELMPVLWLGNVDEAIRLLNEIDPNKIKKKEKLEKLVEYLERVRNYIPCYALRKEVGLRNSSNRGEKANDLSVSARQKDDGKSWSDDGSVGLATVTTVKLNGQLSNWVRTHDINLTWRCATEDSLSNCRDVAA